MNSSDSMSFLDFQEVYKIEDKIREVLKKNFVYEMGNTLELVI